MNDMIPYGSYLKSVKEWEQRPMPEGNVKRLEMPVPTGESVRVANYLRNNGYKVKLHGYGLFGHYRLIEITIHLS